MKKPIFATLVITLLMLTSCGTGSSNPDEFNYFDGKTYTLETLENELLHNWVNDHPSIKGFKRLTISKYSENKLKNFCSNPSVVEIMQNQGDRFLYEMNINHKVCHSEIIDIFEGTNVWMKYNMTAVYSFQSINENKGPVYFQHDWWQYDSWKYNDNGEYSWEVSDVGKRILSNLKDFNNPSYEIYVPSVYASNINYSSENPSYSGKIYLSVMVKRIETNKIAYQIFDFNPTNKTVSLDVALDKYDHSDWVKANNLIHIK